MALQRAKISELDRRFIVGRSAGCCNKCRRQVFIENEFLERARIGDDAHIWAYSEQGPRGRDEDAPQNPNDKANLILLCKNCHAEVDQQTLKFSAAILTAMRDEHYKWVASRLGESLVQKPRFHYILYLNVIRVDMFAVANSIALPSVDFGNAQSFSDLGFRAGQIMTSYTAILNSEGMYAHQVAADSDISGLEAGQYCFLNEMVFRTVAIGESKKLEESWAKDKSIIYRRFGGWKMHCLIDPRWITTSTAGVTLRSGQAELCGVVRVNRTDAHAKKVYASPLFLAQSEGWLDAL